jgi:SAM-dependent methyltransferase
LLLGIAETVDIVEPIVKFSDVIKGKEGVGRIWNVGLEEWDFDGDNVHESMKYDLIWNQWCLGHLTDSQLVEYLKKCGKAVKPGGWILVKENTSTIDEDQFDETDNCVTRWVFLHRTNNKCSLSLLIPETGWMASFVRSSRWRDSILRGQNCRGVSPRSYTRSGCMLYSPYPHDGVEGLHA